MSVTSGFFNSVNGDRRYDARQMTALFNGIIRDGIFASIGNAFAVMANGNNEVAVGIGRAWFNSTWVDNDAILPLSLKVSEVLLNRYDAVVIEVDESDAVRAGSIKVITGTPSSTPAYPTLINTNDVHQYPLAYVYRAAGTTTVTQSNIINMIGTSSAPYITGILQVQNIDNIVAQWQDEWAQWFAKETAEADQSISAKENEINTWFSYTKTSTEGWINNTKTEFEEWSDDQKAEFDTWFANVRATLEGDVAAQLTSKVLALETGTTPAGDANKLGGKSASEYALAEKLTVHEVTSYKGTTVEEINEIYDSLHTSVADKTHYEAVVVNNVAHPILGGGAYYVEGWRDSDDYGWQKATLYYQNKFFYRALFNGEWSGWIRYANAEDLANYLPKSGGNIYGNINLLASGAEEKALRIANDNGIMDLLVGADGSMGLIDRNGQWILRKAKGETPILYGTAEGNLPLSGGKLQREGSTPIEIESLNGMMSLVKFLGMGETLGFLGFSGKDTPVFFHSDGANADTLLHSGNVGDYALPISGGRLVVSSPIGMRVSNVADSNGTFIGFDDVGGPIGYLGCRHDGVPLYSNGNVGYPLHHDGNSAKVAIQETAPTDTTALWVW